MRLIVTMLTLFGLTIHAIFGCCVHALGVATSMTETVETFCACDTTSCGSSATSTTSDFDSFADETFFSLSMVASLEMALSETPSFERMTPSWMIFCEHAFHQVSGHVDFHASCHTHTRCVFPHDGSQRQKRMLATTSPTPLQYLIALPASQSLPCVSLFSSGCAVAIFPCGDVSVSRYALWQRFLF